MAHSLLICLCINTSGNGIESATNAANGDYSTAMGYETIASEDYSTAMGNGTTASGTNSTAMGARTTASSGASIAIGFYTTASSFASTAMGDYTEASGGTSTAMGYFTMASGLLQLLWVKEQKQVVGFQLLWVEILLLKIMELQLSEYSMKPKKPLTLIIFLIKIVHL